MTPTNATASTWTRGVTRRTPRTAGPIPLAPRLSPEEPLLLEHGRSGATGPQESPGPGWSAGGVLDCMGELGPARLLGSDGVRSAQALGIRTRLLPEQREPGQQDS